MMNKLILSSVFCLSVLSLAGQTPVKEFDFTSGKFPAGTEPMLSKRCVGKLKTPLFVKSKDKFALNTGGAGQHGRFAKTNYVLPAQGPFTVTCLFRSRGGWMTALLYNRNGWNGAKGFSVLQNGPCLQLKVGKDYIISTNKENPIQKNTTYFLAISWDGKAWSMYLNGRTFSPVKNAPPYGYPEGNPFLIGGYNVNTNNIFQGDISKVVIYSSALSTEKLHELLQKEIGE